MLFSHCCKYGLFYFHFAAFVCHMRSTLQFQSPPPLRAAGSAFRSHVRSSRWRQRTQLFRLAALPLTANSLFGCLCDLPFKPPSCLIRGCGYWRVRRVKLIRFFPLSSKSIFHIYVFLLFLMLFLFLKCSQYSIIFFAFSRKRKIDFR